MLEGEITKLKHKLIEYATLVENMIAKSMNGLLNKKENLLLEVVKEDEPVTNNYETDLDESCTTIIAQHQPVAVDLRTILMVLKMNNDLERMGDLAAIISDSALYLIKQPLVKPLIDIPKMAQKVKEMLKKSINSFITENTKQAKEVCEMDDEVDGLRDKILRELITYMTKDHLTIERSLYLLRITRTLERMADLCTNICEDVIFMVEGRIIKHHQEER